MSSRRRFLATLALGAAGMRTALGHGLAAADRLPLCFSTLGTPAWRWSTLLHFAAEHGYAALELRTLEETEQLPDRPEFAPARLEETRRQLADRSLRIASVDSSANMHEGDPAARAAMLDEARRFIDLAQALGAPYVRVFGDRYPEGEPRDAVVARIAAGLRELGAYAGARGVMVLLETHGDFTDSPALLDIMQRTASPHVGILWDAHHTFVQAHESPEHTFRALKPYVHHVHLKDSVPAGGERRYVLTGAGEVPVREQVAALARNGYTGLYSFEWEKRWHPELEDPAVALPHFARTMREYLAAAERR